MSNQPSTSKQGALSQLQQIKSPKRFHPPGFAIIYEDQYIIVGSKSEGLLTVAAKWERTHTLEQLLDQYVKKGNTKSKKQIYLVHRLDQGTSGVMVFAKTEKAQSNLKSTWAQHEKIYLCVVDGLLKKSTGRIESHLLEDDDYHVASTTGGLGRLAITEYKVLKESKNKSLLEVNLKTGRKNQIRVHMAELGHPIIGDTRYGLGQGQHLMLHARKLSLIHPFTQEQMTFEAGVPNYFLLHA